jgi:hypothetical protein
MGFAGALAAKAVRGQGRDAFVVGGGVAFVALGIALAATFLLLRRRRRRLAQEGRQAFARLDAVVGAVDAFGEHQAVPAVGAKDD